MHDTYFQILCTAQSPATPDRDAKHTNISDNKLFFNTVIFEIPQSTF